MIEAQIVAQFLRFEDLQQIRGISDGKITIRKWRISRGCVYECVYHFDGDIDNCSDASRAVAVCATKTNAEKLSLEVAQASIENQNISDIKVVLEYADSNCNKWVTGNQVIITVSAYVKTMSPFLSGERSIVHMVTIEDSDELVGNGNAEKIWNYLLSHGITPAGAAGILGNMANESSTNLDPTLLEERAVRRTRITGQMYTQMVDSGEISRAEVISSSRFGLYSGGRYGYGIVQFTDPTIKEYLCRYTIDKGKSIGDLKGQLDSLMAYLQQYEPALLNTLKSIQDVEAASTAFLTQYEKPANIEREKGERASAAQLYYQQLLSN